MLGLLHLALFQVMLPLFAPLIDVFLVFGLGPHTTFVLVRGPLWVTEAVPPVGFEPTLRPF